MPASLQQFSDNRKINPSSERLIQCPYCPQKYLLVWDERESNSVKDWVPNSGNCRAKESPEARRH
jgi:hypothetical protein